MEKRIFDVADWCPTCFYACGDSAKKNLFPQWNGGFKSFVSFIVFGG
jgi:hypothetical protein